MRADFEHHGGTERAEFGDLVGTGRGPILRDVKLWAKVVLHMPIQLTQLVLSSWPGDSAMHSGWSHHYKAS